MPRPSVEIERRRQILTAASELIGERGVKSLRLSDVAARAGVSTATILYYFDSKQAILADALAFIGRQSLERRRLMLATEAPSMTLLRRLIHASVPEEPQTLMGWRAWAELGTEAMHDPHSQQINERLHHEWRELVAGVVAAAQADGSAREGEPLELADMLVSMADGLAIQVLTTSAQMTPARMRRILDAFLEECIARPAIDN